jgi:hypothetical protein
MLKKDLKKQAVDKSGTIRLLLLGSSDSGKSTVLKQMKLHHADGFSQTDRQIYQRHIWTNICESVLALLEASKKFNVTCLTVDCIVSVFLC